MNAAKGRLPRSRSVKRGLQVSLILGLLLVESLTVAGVVISQQIKTKTALDVHTQSLLAKVVNQTRENAQGFLNAGENVVLLAQHLLGEELLSLERPHQMEHYFLSQLEIATHLDGMYYADVNGQFLFVTRSNEKSASRYLTKHIDFDTGERRVRRVWRNADFKLLSREVDLTDTYEPRQRPWFLKARASEPVVWTDPYVFFTSKRPGLTVARRVIQESPGEAPAEFVGVIGADIELTSLSAFLGGQSIGRTGAAVITHLDGDVLAYAQPEKITRRDANGHLRLARLDELDPITTGAARQLARSYEHLDKLDAAHFDAFEMQGIRYRSVFMPFLSRTKWPWVIGVYAPEEEFAGSIREGQRESLVLAIVVSIGITVIALFVGAFVLRPLSKLQQQAQHDPLTTLLNRRGFDEMTRGAVARSHAENSDLSAVMLDIDHFKRINDTHGHAVGDEVLEAIAKRLRNNLSEKDVIGRYGGEEFVILLPATGVDGAVALAERLRRQISSSPIVTTAGPIDVKLSLGVAGLRNDITSLERLIARADESLYEAKRQGRNRVVVASTGETAVMAAAAEA